MGFFSLHDGDDAAALASFERARDILEQAYPDDPLAGGFAVLNISSIQAHQGYLSAAARTLQAYLEAYDSSRGEGEDFDEGEYERNRCRLALLREQIPRARRSCERSLAAFEQRLGPDHYLVGDVRGMLGQVAEAEGRLDEALAHHRHALALYDRMSGHEWATGLTMWTIAELLLHQGERAQARAMLEQALARLNNTLGSAHPMRVEVEVALGRVMVDDGEPEAGLARIRRAMAHLEAASRPDVPAMARPLSAWAVAESLAGEPRVAVTLAERAVEMAERGDLTPPVLAHARFALARSLVAAGGDEERAVRLAAAAREGFVAGGKKHEDDRVEVDAWLADHGAAPPLPGSREGGARARGDASEAR